jgi:hypothetical protein
MEKAYLRGFWVGIATSVFFVILVWGLIYG